MDGLYVRQGEVLREIPVVVPNKWSGEKGCLVGPFSSKEVAKAFAEIYAPMFARLEDEPLFARRDSWFVTVAG